MSLIEQAANRLEQLRRAGSSVSGELAYPTDSRDPSADGSEVDLIEQAAQRMRALQQGDAPLLGTATQKSSAVAPAKPEPVALVASPEPVAAVPTSTVAPPAQSMDEPPELTADVVNAAAREAAEARALGGRRSRSVDIDFERLSARGLLTPTAAQSRLANELRVIKRPIINNCIGKGGTQVKNARRIMVTSAMPGEGKSYISLNLALSIAMEKDSTVLLVEGDPTRPALAEMLGIPPARGLMDLLVDPRIDVSDVMIRTNLGRLSFIPAGTRQEHATELLASTVMEQLVEQLYDRYPDRVLIFDSPPLLAAPEPRVLAQHMGQIVYVVEAEQTAQSTVQEALSTIEACPVVMAVLNKASTRGEGYYYSYYYSNQGE